MLLPPPLRKTRSSATSYCSGLPPLVFAAISCSFLFPSMATACAARVMACVVWLPPETQVHGRFLLVLPHSTSHFSHGTPRTSATTRCTSLIDSVPRLPIPDWIAIRPSGLITNSPSYPTEPAKKALEDTPTPRTFVPLRFARAIRSFHLNCSAPRSSASLRNALVECARLPSLRGPQRALPSGALTRRMSTWSSESLRAAFARIGSRMMIPCIPPGALCGPRGGVLVSIVTPRQRIARG